MVGRKWSGERNRGVSIYIWKNLCINLTHSRLSEDWDWTLRIDITHFIHIYLDICFITKRLACLFLGTILFLKMCSWVKNLSKRWGRYRLKWGQRMLSHNELFLIRLWNSDLINLFPKWPTEPTPKSKGLSHPAYLIYMQSKSCDVLAGWIKTWNQGCQ